MPIDKKAEVKPKAEKALNTRLSTSEDDNVYGMLEAVSKAENRSMNNMIVELIRRAYKSLPKQ